MPYRNIRLHPVLRLIYFVFRALGWLGVTVFYRRRIVLGSAHFRFDGPAILITNHPSTLMDVFNPGIPVRQEMFFLANYGLFRHPVSNWLLTRLYCIPVKRREDVSEGEVRDNNAAFEKSFQHLEKNGVLFIAAEGTSWMNRRVREFKTGTARIALGAEERNDWKLGVKIIPVGLSYSAPHLFRSNVVVHCGEPVDISTWAAAWDQNPEKAVEDLTTDLQRRVTALTIHTDDDESEQFITRLEEVVNNADPQPLEASFFRTQRLAETLQDNRDLRQKTNDYFNNLKKAGLSDAGMNLWMAPDKSIRIRKGVLMLVAGFLPFAAGYVFWFLPCFLPWLLNKKLNLYIGYSSSIKILAGLITFPLALWTACHYLPALFGWTHGGVFILPGLLLLGLLADEYSRLAGNMLEYLKMKRFAGKNAEQANDLALSRRSILAETGVA